MRITSIFMATLGVSIASTALAATPADASPKKSPPVKTAGAHKAPSKPAPPKPPARDPGALRYLDVPGFGDVALYKPERAAKGIALFASGDGGWNLGVLSMAHEATALGYWVAGFSTPGFIKQLDAAPGECADAAGALMSLSQTVAHEAGLPADTKPILIGYSSGATIVYAALAQDGGARIGGGVSLGFCPDLLYHKAYCEGDGLTQHKQTKSPFANIFDKVDTVNAPWRIVQGEADQVCEPHFSPDYAAGQRDSKAILLPKVGHGFGVPRNWMPQYRASLEEVMRATTP